MLGLFVRQLRFKPKPLPQDVRLDGKKALVTGAGVGSLGLEVAKEMASRDLSPVILGVRNTTAGEEARQQITSESPSCNVDGWHVDYNPSKAWPSSLCGLNPSINWISSFYVRA
ncbi:short-chain dehydrogenase reductase SDR [Fusarium albosuccineum]|uniref:Short-chain dehydrogenase reductase SDR n=1 Tax=Fusarium albosuccineum TaxID=1237068 RepID=A0A8H4L0Z0_9HYPO|nr:short-chain dehydrogenase reductase SDR [Fusarium albosuccineum]